MIRRTERTRSEQRLEHFAVVAKEAGIKLTHQRLEIFRELAHTEEHPDAETVCRAVRRRVPTISLDTVYRTLWMLRDIGLVTTLGPNHEAVRFDVNLDRHHHYVCVRCGSVQDFDSDELNGLRVPDAVSGFGTVVDAQVEVRGICAKCQPVKGAAKTRPAESAAPRRNSARKR